MSCQGLSERMSIVSLEAEADSEAEITTCTRRVIRLKSAMAFLLVIPLLSKGASYQRTHSIAFPLTSAPRRDGLATKEIPYIENVPRVISTNPTAIKRDWPPVTANGWRVKETLFCGRLRVTRTGYKRARNWREVNAGYVECNQSASLTHFPETP